MIKLTFKNSSIELYDDFILINKAINDSIKIYKSEISCFMLEKTIYKTKVKGGSVGASVRITKGAYIRTSTPYYKTVNIKRYNPVLVLKSSEKIIFDTILDNDTVFTLYKENIRRFSLWLKSVDLDEFNKNEKIEKEKMEEEALNLLKYVKIFIAWTIAFIISAFLGNDTLIKFVGYSPIILILFLIVLHCIKRKQWIKALIGVLIAILIIPPLMA